MRSVVVAVQVCALVAFAAVSAGAHRQPATRPADSSDTPIQAVRDFSIAGFEGKPEQLRARVHTANASDASVVDALADVVRSVGKLREATTAKLGKDAGDTVSLFGTRKGIDAMLARAKESISGNAGTIEAGGVEYPLTRLDAGWRVDFTTWLQWTTAGRKQLMIKGDREAAKFIDGVTAKVKNGDLRTVDAITAQMKKAWSIGAYIRPEDLATLSAGTHWQPATRPAGAADTPIDALRDFEIATFEGKPEQFRARVYTAGADDAAVMSAYADKLRSVGRLREVTTAKLGAEVGNRVSILFTTLGDMDAELALAKVSISGNAATVEMDHFEFPLVRVDGRWRVYFTKLMKGLTA